MQRLVRNEITLKGCHLVFIERRGIRPTPHIPDIIHGENFFFIAVFVKISSTDQLVDLVHQFLTPIFLSSDIDTLETAILIQRHGSMIQKVRITYQIHAAIGKQTTHVLFQLFTIHERNLSTSSFSSSVRRYGSFGSTVGKFVSRISYSLPS